MADTTQIASVVWTARDYLYLGGVIISCGAALLSGYGAWKTSRRDLNSLGDSEIKTFEMIAKAEKDFAEHNARILQKSHDKTADNSSVYSPTDAENSLTDFYATAVLNAYEIACQRYLDGKLDKERFKKTYSKRLGKINSRQSYKRFIDKGDYNFSALSTVNKKFNDDEAK